MKIGLCDVCLSEEKLTLSRWYWKRKTKIYTFRVDVCEKHKDWGKEKNRLDSDYEDVLSKAVEYTHRSRF